MQIKSHKKATMISVTRQFFLSGHPVGEAESEDQEIDVHVFQTTPAQVGVDYGLTLNLGNFESARISVNCSVPCYKEEMDAAYEHAVQWTTTRIRKEVAEVRTGRAGGNNG